MGEDDGGGPFSRGVAGEGEGKGERRVVPGAPTCPGSVRLGSNGAVVGRKLLGGGSPAIEYALVIGAIEKAIVYE